MKPHRSDMDYDMATEYPEKNISGIYRAVSYHRNGTAGKSQWSITIDEEIALFAYAKEEGYTDNGRGHAIWVVDTHLIDLGFTANGNVTKLARFVDGTHTDNWHGYPANYLYAKNDIPPTSILRNWVERNLISKSDLGKIQKQKPCKLQKSV